MRYIIFIFNCNIIQGSFFYLSEDITLRQSSLLFVEICRSLETLIV